MRFATAFTLALPAIAAATAVPRTEGDCNTGDIQCCTTVQSASDPSTAILAGLLGVVLGPITGLVGFNCSPLSVIGVGGTSCSTQPVCCTGNEFNGLINVGCTPVNINL